MNAVIATIGATIALAAAVGTLVPEASVAKCMNVPIQFADAPEPVFVLDARAVDRDTMKKLDQQKIASIEVVCADYIYQTFRIEARRSGVVIFTKPGPESLLRAAMDSISTLQARFLARTGRVASTLSELGWADAEGLITVDLKIAEEGTRWSATGKHRYLGSKRGGVTVEGSKTPPSMSGIR